MLEFISVFAGFEVFWIEGATKVVYKNGALKNFAKFTGKYLCQSLIPGTLLKERLWHKFFLVNFAKFLKKPCLKSIFKRLLLSGGQVLTNFRPLVSFHAPRKHRKATYFLMFSGGIEKDQCHKVF